MTKTCLLNEWMVTLCAIYCRCMDIRSPFLFHVPISQLSLLCSWHTRNPLQRTSMDCWSCLTKMLQNQEVPGILCLSLGNQCPVTEVQEYGSLGLMLQGSWNLPVQLYSRAPLGLAVGQDFAWVASLLGFLPCLVSYLPSRFLLGTLL